MKLLGPWPVLQLIFGLAVLGFGAWMIARGVAKKPETPPQIEDKRQQWEAYNQLENIEGEAFKQTEILSRILDRLENNSRAMNTLMTELWNNRQWPRQPPTP